MAEIDIQNLGSEFLKKIQPNKDVVIEGMRLIILMVLPQTHLISYLGEIQEDYGRYQRIAG